MVNKFKRMLAVVLMLSVVLTLIPSFGFVVDAESKVNSETVKQTIQAILKEYPSGSYFSVNGKRCEHGSIFSVYSNGKKCYNCELHSILKSKGIKTGNYANGRTCYSFASYSFTKCFGKPMSSTYYDVVGSTNFSSSKTDKYKYDFLKKAKVGDILFTGGHYMVFIKCDEKGVTVYDSNVGGTYYCSQGHSRCGTHKADYTQGGYTGKVRYATVLYKNFNYSSIKIWHAKNYDDRNNYIISLNAVTKVTNTSATINSKFNASLPAQKLSYLISTNKSDVDIDGTNLTNRDKAAEKGCYVKVYDYSSNPKNVNSFSAKIDKYLGKNLIPNTKYYYKVLVKSGNNWYQSGVGAFTTLNNKPGAPTLQIAGGKTDVAISDSIAVTWSSVSNAESYNLNVYDSDGGVVYNKNGIKGNSLTLSDVLKSAGDYYVSLTAVNAMGKTDSKDKLKITVHADNVVKFCDTISGEVLKTEVVPYGHSATAPSAPSQKGYTFIKWDKPLDNITENVEINTVYEAHKYTVTFVDGKGNLISKEIVKRDEAVENVPEAPAKSGYTFVAWTVKSGSGSSYTKVDGDVTFEPTYLWENPDLPLSVEVKSALRNSNARGYTVTSNIVNGSDKDITAKLITIIKTSNGKVVATKIDVLDIPANTDSFEHTALVGGSSVGTVAEVYVVANDKANDNKTGGAYSEKATAKVTRESTTESTYWGEWSEWSTEAATASDTREVEKKTQYAYSDKVTTTSTSSSLAGWTKTGSTVTYGSWGSWSSWSTTAQTETSTKDVEVRTVYKYQHYCDGNGGIAPTTGYTNAKYGPHILYSTTKFTINRTSSAKDANGNNYKIADGHTKCAKGSGSYYYMGTVKQYRYRTRTATTKYSYYKWNDFSAFSDTVYTASDTREVKTRVVYRYRDLLTKTITESSDYIGEENLTGTLYQLSGNIKNVVEDYSGKVATIMVYKDKNTDPSESQIEYIGQTVIGENNSYSFSFIPREEISFSTGNYIVSFGIATADGLINYVDIIEAPKPQYTVTFFDFDGTTELYKATVSQGESVIIPDNYLDNLSVPEGCRFTNWNQSTVNVQSDLRVLPLSEKETFVAVFIDWGSQNVVLQELEYGDEIIPPAAQPKDGMTVTWDMSAAQKVVDEVDEPAESEGQMENDTNERYIIVQNTVITTKYEEIVYESVFISPDSEIAKNENEGIETDDLSIPADDIIATDESVFEDRIETPEAIEEADEYIFYGWKNLATGKFLEDTLPESDAVYVPIYAFAETVEAPVASVKTGEYTSEQTVTLTCETASAEIFYTLDGTDPQHSETAVLYTEPIAISSSTTLKFCAMAVNMNNSDTIVELYAINSEDLVPYHIVSVYSDLPYAEEIVYQALVKDFVRFDDSALKDVEGYIYSGLYFDDTYTEAFDASSEPVVESMNLYASYTPKQFIVTFIDSDSTVLSTQTVNYSEAAQEPTVPAKDGYVFVGWDSDGYQCVTEDGTYTAEYVPESEYATVTILGRKTRAAFKGTEIKLTAVITPEELSGTSVSWESSDPTIATVDYNGVVSCIGVGTVFITATVDSTGESSRVQIIINEDNTCNVVLGPQSYLVVDSHNYIRGLKVATNTVEEVRSHFTNDYLYFYDINGAELAETDKVGTGTVVKLLDGDEILDEETFVMTGDVNGDGWYDGQDSTIVSCLANGLLTSDDVSEAVYLAADCNYDGVIDIYDVIILEKAGTLLASVDQNAPVEELELQEDYIAYVALIDQTYDGGNTVIDTPETDEPDDNNSDNNGDNNGSNEADTPDNNDSDNPQDGSFESIIKMIIAFIRTVVELIASFIPALYR